MNGGKTLFTAPQRFQEINGKENFADEACLVLEKRGGFDTIQIIRIRDGTLVKAASNEPISIEREANVRQFNMILLWHI